MRVLCVFVFAMILLTACTDRIICPAYQSTYILDDSTRTAFYSYAWKLDEGTRQQYIASLSAVDTTQVDSIGMGDAPPKNNWSEYYAYAGRYVQPREEVRKTKYGIVKREPHWLKKYKLRTAPMVNVYGPERQQTGPVDEGEFYASDFDSSDSLGIVSSDSLGLDSTAVARQEVPSSVKQKKEQKYRFRYDPDDNFNAEQDYYNKYFGKLLVDNRPDPKPAPVDTLANQTAVPDSLQTEKNGLRGLFKKKKKKQNEEDSESQVDPPAEGVPAEENNEEEDPEEGGGN